MVEFNPNTSWRDLRRWRLLPSTHKLLKLLIIMALETHINHWGVNALILSVGDKCDVSVKSETFSPSRDLEILNGTVFGFDHPSSPPICDPSMPLECNAGRCQCKRGFTISRNGTKCLEIARNGLESPCEESIQCWKGLLGRLSECKRTMDGGRCFCYESEALPIIFHQGRCYYGETLNDYCQIDGLCEATTPNAECRTTCQCKEGFTASWDKSRCLQIAINGLNSSCEENVQCEKSILGTLSECNQETMKCQCYQIPETPTVFTAGKCYFGSGLTDVCQVNQQCQAKTEHSTCGKDGKCHCEDHGYVPNHNQTTCLPIPSADGTLSVSGSECVEDIQCTKALGHFAKCNIAKRKCECFVPENVTHTTEFLDPDEPVTAMVIIGRKCHSTKNLNQFCKFNKQCSTATAKSICYNGQCECEDTHVPSQDLKKCLEIGQDGTNSSCDEDVQCTRSPMGPLSMCNLKTKKCECSNILPVVYYEKKCFFHRYLGSPCKSHSECKSGGNFLAECAFGRCRCINGTQTLTDYSCIHSSSGSGSLISRFSLPINRIFTPLIAILCVHSL